MSSTTAIVIWNETTATEVRSLIGSGKSVPAHLVKLAPKGFVSDLRKARMTSLRNNSQVIMAQLEKEGYRIERLPVQFDAETKTFTGAKHNARTGDLTIDLKLVKRAKTEVSKEDAMAALGLTQEDMEAVKQFLAQRDAQPTPASEQTLEVNATSVN